MKSDVIFICVGTPEGENGIADLSHIECVARDIASCINCYKLIVEKSTVPVNTYQRLKKTIERYSDKEILFDIASNPEFLREGSAIHDFMNPDRIIIGVESEKARSILNEIYKNFNCPIIFTNPATAELIKHASNSFLALKISYINMIADLCEKVGADITLVADGMGYDKRIGRAYLDAGLGFGGSCFGKDVRAFIEIADSHRVNFNLLKEVIHINQKRRFSFVKKIEDILWVNYEKNIAIWGLAFKPNTDDIRDAPSIDIVDQLYKKGAFLRLYDPKAMDRFRNLFPNNSNIQYFSDKYDALINADILVLLTEWEEFLKADLSKVKSLMRLPIIIDGRNIFRPEILMNLGFEYYSIGRKL